MPDLVANEIRPTEQHRSVIPMKPDSESLCSKMFQFPGVSDVWNKKNEESKNVNINKQKQNK